VPDHQQVQDFYNKRYYGHINPNDRSSLPWHVRRIAARLGALRDKTVLDVACGTGGWLQELKSRGARVSGIDISARAVEVARERLAEADIRTGVAEQLPFGDGQFDLVTCMGSLEHFLDQPCALREMLRVAKPGATFLILVPNAGFLTRRLGLYRGTGQTTIRETVRPIEEWTEMFAAAGLQVHNKWRDLHPLSRVWICHGAMLSWPVRAAQAVALALWPIRWQYQVYFLCRLRGT
jgi:SAM-dependent methyltransferase